MQKTFSVLALLALAGAGIYEVQRASRLQQQMIALQQQRAKIGEQLVHYKSDNENLSNQLVSARQAPGLSAERLRELLRLRGEVGQLRRRQREMEQALAGQQEVRQRDSQQAPGPQSIRPSPFQVQLVLDGPGEDSTSMTNDSSAGHGELLQVQKTPLMDHTAIRSASAARDQSSGAPVIDIEFSTEGQELFAAVTRENINKRLALVLDGRLFSAPVIRSEIPAGKAEITGNFTEEEAKELAAKINEAIPPP